MAASLARWFFAIITYRFTLGLLEMVLWYMRFLIEGSSSIGEADDTISSSYATIVCATHNTTHALLSTIETWLANKPAEIIIVASPASYAFVDQICAEIESDIAVRVLRADRANKRAQLCLGFREARTEVIVAADDDARWSLGMLSKLAAPIKAMPKLGCVFPDLRLTASTDPPGLWEQLAQFRRAGAGLNILASHYVDGGVYVHRGPTGAYRASILQDPSLIMAFLGETWRGQDLNSGDDQFLCRWVESHNWETKYLPAHEAVVYAGTRQEWTLLLQLLRWSRGDWRSNLSALFWERHIWRIHPYTAIFVRLDWCLDPFITLVEITCLVFHWRISAVTLMLLSRLPRHIPYVLENPSVIIRLPLFLLYLYAHSVIKLYALFTLSNNRWT